MRHDVEGKGDQALIGRTGLACMLHGAVQQFVADALSLSARCNKQFCQKPELTINPAQGKSHNFVIILGQPHAARIVSKAEGLEIRRPRRGNRPKAVADGHLKRLPLYELKIDRSFIKDTPADSNVTAIVTSIVGVAKPLQLHVVAEGVKTQAQVDFLKAIGCDAMRGYLFARPMSISAWLEGAKSRFVVSNQLHSN